MAELAPNGCNGWFGETWHAPACEPEMEVPTPVGEKCLNCEEEIVDGDRGFTMSYFGTQGASVVPIHAECQMRSVLGGALCAEGTCVHCGDGSAGAISDDPRLTRREAAIAAVAAHERKHGRFFGP